MHRRHLVSPDLLRVAAFHDGVLTKGQCVAHGLTRHSLDRLVREGWQRLAPGIYFTQPGEPGFRAWALAATAYAGPGSCVGLHGAAHLHGWTPRAPSLVEVWVPRRKDIDNWRRVRFRRDSLGRAAVHLPACTEPAATALDLCVGASPDQVVGWLARAARHGGTRLARELDRRPRQPHRALIAEMLSEVEAGSESPLEVRFVRHVLVAHGLPVGTRQLQTAAGRVDLVDEPHRVAYELDGRLGHEGPGAFRDARRDNTHAAAGLVTLRYGWADVVARPCLVAAQVTRVLRTRGWRGSPRRCRRCRTQS